MDAVLLGLIGLLLLCAMIVALAFIRTRDSEVRLREQEAQRVAWERVVKSQEDQFEKIKKHLFGSLEAVRRRAADAENSVYTGNQQIHALMTQLGQRSVMPPPPDIGTPPELENGALERVLRRPRVAVLDDNVEGGGDGALP